MSPSRQIRKQLGIKWQVHEIKKNRAKRVWFCEKCGRIICHKNQIEAHHIVPLSFVKDSNIPKFAKRYFATSSDNIQLLCHKCHRKIHNNLNFKSI